MSLQALKFLILLLQSAALYHLILEKKQKKSLSQIYFFQNAEIWLILPHNHGLFSTGANAGSTAWNCSEIPPSFMCHGAN